MPAIADLHVRLKAGSQTGDINNPLRPPREEAAECGNDDFSVIYGAFRLTTVRSTPDHVRRELSKAGFTLDSDEGNAGDQNAVDSATAIQNRILVMGWS